eukprot:138657-Prorocentrum_lima.AAC.1
MQQQELEADHMQGGTTKKWLHHVFRLFTWNSPEWVWPRGELDLARGELDECLPAIRLLPRVTSLWPRVHSDILNHVERMR